MTRLLSWVTALLAIFAIEAGGAPEPKPVIVKVGCLFPLTGSAGIYGRDSVVASRMAIAKIEESTRPVQVNIELLIEDTRSKPLRSLQIARRFLEEEKVDFLCGSIDSNIVASITELSRAHNVIVIETDNLDHSVNEEEANGYYFRMGSNSELSMRAGAKVIQRSYARHSRLLKIAFIGPDTLFGYKVWQDLTDSLHALGVSYEVVGVYWPRLSETDYSAYIRKLSNVEPDIIVDGHWGLDFIAFLNQATQLGLVERTQLMNFNGGGSYEIFAELGEYVPSGLVLSARHHLNWPDTQRNRQFVRKFHERSGRFPSFAAESAYSALLAIGTVVQQAGGTSDKAAISRELEDLRIELPSDPNGFQSYMDAGTHQLMHALAIGKTEYNNEYPPAAVQLGNWLEFYPSNDEVHDGPNPNSVD